jgi:hypothetical protein
METNYELKEWKEWIYYYTEKSIGVHLGVADKFIVNKFYPEYEQKKNIGVFRSLREFLEEFRYENINWHNLK